jgi:hypothetical protein
VDDDKDLTVLLLVLCRPVARIGNQTAQQAKPLSRRGIQPNEGLNCYGNVLTAWRTVNPPMTPDGEVEPRVATMGSMWAFRGRLRPVPYAGLSRVRAEPPCTMPRAL